MFLECSEDIFTGAAKYVPWKCPGNVLGTYFLEFVLCFFAKTFQLEKMSPEHSWNILCLLGSHSMHPPQGLGGANGILVFWILGGGWNYSHFRGRWSYLGEQIFLGGGWHIVAYTLH